MPPQTRRARTDASERTPPAPTNPLATQTTRGNLRHTATPQGEASQPTRASGSSSADNSRGFAPLASQSNRGSGSDNPGSLASSSQNLQQTPEMPPRSTPTHAFPQPPRTPGHAAAHRLHSQLNQQSVLASPGPRMHDPSDSESDLEDEDPPIPVGTRRTAIRPLNLMSDSDEESPPQAPGRPSRARVRGPAVQHAGADQSVVQPSSDNSELDTWKWYHIDQENYAWAENSVLTANTKSADCQAFFGEHIEHRGYKCSQCSQHYASGSSLTTRRRHLAKEHLAQYLQLIKRHNLPNKLPDALLKQREEERAKNLGRIPFSIPAFVDQLVTVIVSNDLSINLVENHDFRDLLLMLRESLQDGDIPHRGKLRALILDAWLKYYETLKKELKASLGKLSFTVDMWSSKGLQPYLAITIHWLGRKGEQATLRQALLAFRRVRGSHSGQRLARIIFEICDQAEILDKIGHFTMDNASNNATFMEYFSELLAERGILNFDAKGNYIRCFAHIINLCSQAVIRAMEKEDSRDIYPETETETEPDEDVPARAVRACRRAGPIRRARKTVAFIRKSGQRRDELLVIIKQGNERQLWTELHVGAENADRVVVVLAEVIVVADVKTRWDSVFYMLRRLRYLQQPVTQFFAMNPDAHSFNHPLENRHWNRLEILELILQQPHTVQTIMSAENTPILAATIPAFELFMSSWESMMADNDLKDKNVAQIITPGLSVTKNYYDKLGNTDAYIIAMFINPSIRLEWIKKNWSSQDQQTAKNIILNKLRLYQDQDAESPVSRSTSRSGSQGSRPSSRPRTPAAASTMLVNAARKYRNVHQALDFSAGAPTASGDHRSVEEEMDSYVQSPIPSPQTTDMIGYWMNHGITTWPTIYRLFVDYAPIQATSVPSERVFSSSAETDTKRRNRISPHLMEALQMLKFNFKKS